MVVEAPSVAVIGLGALGLVAMKNLLEEGFDVTGFDKNGYLGGLWRYNEKPQISVLKSTVSNGSKQRGCFTDFPFPDDTPDFPSAADMDKYLNAYAEHFWLIPRARLNTLVHLAEWNEKRGKWGIEISTGEAPKSIEYFDKVVYSMGPDQIPNIPTVTHIEKFAGDIQHSITFKKPEEWAGKRVLVVGFGNTAADVADVLVGVASKVFLSHRSGAVILPRWVDGKPIDHIRTYRKGVFLEALSRYAPGWWEKIMNKVILGMRNRIYNLQPEWRFDPPPSVNQVRPMVSDHLVEHLMNGEITSVTSISRVIDEQTIELSDSMRVKVDAIIWCTGYTVDYSILGRSDPTLSASNQWQATKGSTGRSLPKLYQNLFSLDRPNSLAFMGHLSFMNPAFVMFDIATMALAQVWKGSSRLPSQAEMERQADDHHKWISTLAMKGPVIPGLVKAADWMDWAEDAAGLGMKENLGYGVKGWYFWFSDRAFCKMLMDGLLLPMHYRVFNGKRKRWDGAKAEIIKVNKALAANGWTT